ncbi:MAG TPA: ABC transporter ATP-binding protein [Gemmatimonadales bacterium]|nr:ABC transporter ATP-binding protein [Gemmatimonadales bacterium]
MPNTSDRVSSRTPGIELHHVWKKFRRGELHDSLRDLVPAVTKRLLGRGPKRDDLAEGDFWALRNVDCEIGPGEALGIIGANGAGKSTVLKILTRILQPTRGWCEVRGRVGALIEIAAGFHPDLTGRENIFLQGSIIGMPSSYIAKRFDEIVDFSGIEPFIDTPVKRYSSGMNARLGFAIAAHLDPEVLVIDEVLAVGDLAFQQKCYDRLTEFRRSGIPIAFVSHNMQAVASVCDRAMLLRHGQEPLMGEVSDMLAAYTSGGGVTTEDKRIGAVRSKVVRAADGEPLMAPIHPGEELRLELEIDAAADLDRTQVSFQVFRSDGMRVYDALCGGPAAPVLHIPAGRTASCEVRFRANLLRGTYMVGVTLLEADRRREHIRLNNLGSFVIDERESWSGVAALQGETALRLSPTARVELVG